MRAFVVHNPAAIPRRDWPVISAALKTVFPRHVTVASPGRGHTARLVRDALRDGHEEIVVVGGDGAANEAVNGFFEHGQQVSPDATLSIVPTTQGDIAQGRPTGVAAALQLAHAPTLLRDLGFVSCLTPEGGTVTRFFLNAASFGITGDMARRMNRARIAALPGPAFTRAFSESLALARWRPCRVRLIADDGQDEIAGIAAVGILNGASFGGGLQTAAKASPADGQFDIAILSGGPRRSIARALARLRTGDATPLRQMRSTRLTAAPTVETRGAVLVETDGETVGMLPASFQIAPSVIRIRI